MIGPNEVHVWYADLSTHPDILTLLNEEERARAARFLADRPRQQFIAARAWLRSRLGHLLGVPPQSIAFASTGNGKPTLPGATFHFNLSHSGQGAILAVSRDYEVGVDLEWVRPRDSFRDLAQRYFTPVEVDAITDLRAFYAIWTRKEAFLKALGLGLAGGLERFAVNADDPPRVLHVDGDPAAAAHWTLLSLEPRPGALAAVAVPAADAHIHYHNR
jgi:4'-phosphopantetheinyl transferase